MTACRTCRCQYSHKDFNGVNTESRACSSLQPNQYWLSNMLYNPWYWLITLFCRNPCISMSGMSDSRSDLGTHHTDFTPRQMITLETGQWATAVHTHVAALGTAPALQCCSAAPATMRPTPHHTEKQEPSFKEKGHKLHMHSWCDSIFICMYVQLCTSPGCPTRSVWKQKLTHVPTHLLLQPSSGGSPDQPPLGSSPQGCSQISCT